MRPDSITCRACLVTFTPTQPKHVTREMCSSCCAREASVERLTEKAMARADQMIAKENSHG